MTSRTLATWNLLREEYINDREPRLMCEIDQRKICGLQERFGTSGFSDGRKLLDEYLHLGLLAQSNCGAKQDRATGTVAIPCDLFESSPIPATSEQHKPSTTFSMSFL